MNALQTTLARPDLGRHLTRHTALRSGLLDLDALLISMEPGVWVVTGLPGVGKSMLACQLARTAAVESEMSVRILHEHEDHDLLVAWLLAAQAGVPVQTMRAGMMIEADLARLHTARDSLAATPLDLLPMASLGQQGLDDLLAGPASARVLAVLDGPSLVPDATRLGDLRRWCLTANSTVILEMPVDVVVDGDDRLLPGWHDEADVVLRVERPEQSDPETDRPGEADLVIQRHRRGPTATVTVGFAGHYAMFRDFPQIEPHHLVIQGQQPGPTY